jgi:glyoxylase-like metal-dependent hydrolase (beta-lactamase superfamily II)
MWGNCPISEPSSIEKARQVCPSVTRGRKIEFWEKNQLNIQQIRLSKMATFCYVVGDESSRTCTLIDPASDTRRILGTADSEGWRITHVINTHCHADHTAGNAAIKEQTQAKILIHELDARGLKKRTSKVFSRMLS